MSASTAQPRLLLIYLKPTSFVTDDWALLEEHYDVRAFHFDADEATSALGLARLWMRQLWWLLRELPSADLVLGWFADYHVALPVLLARWVGVPVAVVLGGMDCNWVPELDYGVWESRWRAPLVRGICRHASMLLPVSPALIYHENAYACPPQVLENGIRAHVPGLETPHRAIPTGYPPEAWPMGPLEREDVVSTVAIVDDERRMKVKGVDVLIEAARRLPAVTFQVVGVTREMRPILQEKYDPPQNVTLFPPRDRSDLVGVYHGTSVYTQLSRTEGLPNVMAEAMCCGCIPVGSRVGGVPELVEETGEIVERPDPDEVAARLRRALNRDEADRRAARARIEKKFSKAQREEQLLAVLADLWA